VLVLVVVIVVVVVDVLEVDLGGADGVPRVPGDLQDHERDREADQRVTDLEPERDDGGARDHAERDEAVDPGVLAVGDQRRAREPAAGPQAELGCELVASEPEGSKAVKTLFILNGPPYGTERSYNDLRLAGSVAKRNGEEVRIFLMGDAVGCALQGQVVPDGYYRLDRMLGSAIRHGGEVGCCGTCMDARAIDDGQLLEGARRSTLEELTDWTLWADKVITF
jgi:uncharacterized protein involved in oxidation of intracellular sulfur